MAKIKGGAMVNPDEDEVPPLLLAAQAERLPLVRLLLENGADMGARDKRGYTVFHYVDDIKTPRIREAMDQVLEIFMKKGSD